MVRKLLADTWTFFKDNVLFLSLIILPIVVAEDIFTALYQHFLNRESFTFSQQLVPFAIGVIAYPIYSVGVIFYIASARSGKRIDTKTAWWLGVKFWLPYVALTILVGLLIFVGFIFFIIPGIILAIRFAFSGFDLLLNENNPVEAMKNSWHATREYMGVLFSGNVLLALALLIPYFLITLIFGVSDNSLWSLNTALNIIYSVLGTLFTIFTFHVYELAKGEHKEVA